MKYKNIKQGIFIKRPNRFIAHVEIEGKEVICHVKNTGRCEELLIRGSTVFVNEVEQGNRKTKFDLVNVCKGKVLVNIDSQMPNKIIEEYLQGNNILQKISYLKREKTYKKSRFDFYIEEGERKIFIEVKGVTLEKNGVALFPDAPTERGVKHVLELIDAKKNGFDCYIIFVIQLEGVSYFTPNKERHKEFQEVLKVAKKSGVEILAIDTVVSKDEIYCNKNIEVRI